MKSITRKAKELGEVVTNALLAMTIVILKNHNNRTRRF